MSVVQFRIYVRDGCPACQMAHEWFKDKLPAELIVVGNDPVLNAGVEKFGGVPVLISFLTNEYIVGFQPKEYERLRTVFIERSSPGSFRMAGAEGQPVRPPADVAESKGAAYSGTARLPDLPRDVAGATDPTLAIGGDGLPGLGILR